MRNGLNDTGVGGGKGMDFILDRIGTPPEAFKWTISQEALERINGSWARVDAGYQWASHGDDGGAVAAAWAKAGLGDGEADGF